MPYTAPVADFSFLLDHVVGFERLRASDRFADASEDVTQAILENAYNELIPVHLGQGQPVDVGGLWMLLKVMLPCLKLDDLSS